MRALLLAILIAAMPLMPEPENSYFKVYAIEFPAIADPEIDWHSIENAYDISSLMERRKDRLMKLLQEQVKPSTKSLDGVRLKVINGSDIYYR